MLGFSIFNCCNHESLLFSFMSWNLHKKHYTIKYKATFAQVKMNDDFQMRQSYYVEFNLLHALVPKMDNHTIFNSYLLFIKK